mgnify:CR=1 FL=1
MPWMLFNRSFTRSRLPFTPSAAAFGNDSSSASGNSAAVDAVDREALRSGRKISRQLVAEALGAEMPVFKQLDLLVHDLALEVHAAAKAEDRSAAIEGYQRMIEGCFACHEAYKDRVAAALGIERNGDAWESYVSDPAKVPEAELVTLIYYPVRPD